MSYTVVTERGRFRVFNSMTRAMTNGRFHSVDQAEQWIAQTEDKECRSGREMAKDCASRDYAGDNERVIRRVGGGL